jgi:hypothetical protein
MERQLTTPNSGRPFIDVNRMVHCPSAWPCVLGVAVRGGAITFRSENAIDRYESLIGVATFL